MFQKINLVSFKVKSFLEKLSYDEIEKIEAIESALVDELLEKLFQSKINLHIGGDDSYINLCYNILSHGEKKYNIVLKNPNILYDKEKDIAHEGSGYNSFLMSYFLLY